MSLEDEVVALLKDQGLTLTTAESCTAGLLAGRVMNVAGASAVYEEGYILSLIHISSRTDRPVH